MPVPSGSPVGIDGPGISGTEFFGATLLVASNGLSDRLEGAGLYAADACCGAVQVFASSGDAAGGVLILRDGVPRPQVLVGGVAASWPDGGAGGRVFVIDRDLVPAALMRGHAVANFATGLQRFEWPAQLAPLRGRRFVTFATDSPFVIREYTWDATTGLVMGAETTLANAGEFVGVHELDGGVLALTHDRGVLLVHLE